MADRYRVGGSGNTSDTAHWSDQTGGAGGFSVPGTSDNAIFDNLSHITNYTVTINSSFQVIDLTINAPASGNVTVAGSSATQITGNYYAYTGKINTYSGGFTHYRQSLKTIRCGGSQITAGTFTLSGSSGGTTSLQDDFLSGAFGTNGGNLITNGYNITTGSFIISGTVIGRNSTINCTSFGVYAALALSGTTTIKCTGNFAGFGQTYYNVELNGATSTITGSNTFHDLKIGGNIAQTISFTGATDQTVTTFTCVGSLGKEKTLQSTNTTNWKISDTAGTNICDFMNISRSTAEGGAIRYLGTNSVDGGNNTGWTTGIPLPIASFTKTLPYQRTAQFTDTSINTPTSRLWDFDDGTTSTSQNPQHIYTNYGTYTVTLTATNAGGSDSVTGTVEFLEPSFENGGLDTDTYNREIGIMLQRRKYYDDPLNSTKYYADAPKGTALNEARWRVMKIVQTKVFVIPVAEETSYTANYDNLATDLSTVQSLTYI